MCIHILRPNKAFDSESDSKAYVSLNPQNFQKSGYVILNMGCSLSFPNDSKIPSTLFDQKAINFELKSQTLYIGKLTKRALLLVQNSSETQFSGV